MAHTDTREDARLTADVVALADVDGDRHVLLIRRGWAPFAGLWALPGGHVDPGEDTEAAARRELAEETGLPAAQLTLDLVGVYGQPGRDPRGRYVTYAYRAELPVAVVPAADNDATDARWIPVRQALDEGLAFDHADILTAALAPPSLPALARALRAGLLAAFGPDDEQIRQTLCLAEEAGEFVQAARRYLGLARTPGDLPPVVEELADVVLTAYVTAEAFDIDLTTAIARKAAEIHTRGYRATLDGPKTAAALAAAR
jgi:8-oxo-dGTP diphosphatase